MALKITFELSESDLDYFRGVMAKAQSRVAQMDEHAIISAAEKMAQDSNRQGLSAFVQESLATLDVLIRMLKDKDWRLDGKHRARVLDALAYFADPSDMIADDIPVLGLLDDAIMVDLVARELKPELDAYTDFCRFREERAKAGVDPEQHKAELDAERHAMLLRMERRRESRARRGGSLFGFR